MTSGDRYEEIKPLRVMTWNIWWRFGPWRERQEAIVRTLRETDADVVFLQEVWAESHGDNQAEQLAGALGYEYAYARANDIDGVELGNAILSRWPLVDSDAIELPMSDLAPERRCALHAVVRAPFALLPVVTTHLTWQRNNSRGRQEQVRAVLALTDSLATSDWPPILGGDFNADPDSDEIRMITGKSIQSHDRLVFQDAWVHGGDESSSGATWTPRSKHFATTRSTELAAMPWLSRRLDYLFVGLPDGRPHKTIAVQVEKAWLAGKGENETIEGSDHYAVVADLRPRLLG